METRKDESLLQPSIEPGKSHSKWDISPLNMALGQAGMEELDEDRVRVGLGGVLWMGPHIPSFPSRSRRRPTKRRHESKGDRAPPPAS